MKTSELPKQDLLPAAKYRVGIKGGEKKVGKESGIGYLDMSYQVTDGAYKKRVIFDKLSFSPAALWRVRSFLAALEQLDVELPVEKGADGGFVVTNEEQMSDAILQASMGREFEVEVNEVKGDPSKGFKDKNDVVAYYPCGEARSRWDS